MQPEQTIHWIDQSIHSFTAESSNDNYEGLLRRFNFTYRVNGEFLEVGEPQKGPWILDLSIIPVQLAKVLEYTLPILREFSVPFRIPIDTSVAARLYTVDFGYTEIGRVICIYPPTPAIAVQLVELLRPGTGTARGADVPGSVYIGGAIYTRRREDQTIPFVLPKNIPWPFPNVKRPPSKIPSKRILQGRYIGLEVIKPDIKGIVIRAIDIKYWWKFEFREVVGKQGKRAISHDQLGRTIKDRLYWQYQLQSRLIRVLPVPEPFDFRVDENGDAWFWMEYVDGSPIHLVCSGIADQRVWWSLDYADKAPILSYFKQILAIVVKLHDLGYIHRDLSPVNFLLDKTAKIRPIDLELAYSAAYFHNKRPFTRGTPGFMSPEQRSAAIPTPKEDIFGLGSLFIALLIGLYPTKLEPDPYSDYVAKVNFFLNDLTLSTLIAACRHPNPDCRPTLSTLKSAIAAYVGRIQTVKPQTPSTTTGDPDTKWAIRKCVQAFVSGTLARQDGLWHSGNQGEERYVANESKNQIVSPGWYHGISGVLYAVAELKRNGINISAIEPVINFNLQWLLKEYMNVHATWQSGLHHGSYGVAIGIASAIEGNFLKSSPELTKCLQHILAVTSMGDNVANGTAGQGLATLRCIEHIDADFADNLLRSCAKTIIETQQPDGSWNLPKEGSPNKKRKYVGFSFGITGILYFLLRYYEHSQDASVKPAIDSGLAWIKNHARITQSRIDWPYHPKSNRSDRGLCLGDGGVILTLLAAFAVLKEDQYRVLAENALRSYPIYHVQDDFSLANGLAGTLFLYSFAKDVTGNSEWNNRIEFLTNVFLKTYTYNSESDSISWYTTKGDTQTDDLFSGNAGILYALVRSLGQKNDTVII